MSKQIFIDSNGNEILLSGTVNSADMLPMSASDSTKVSTAIGDLSILTTTHQASLVEAVNEVDSDIGTINTALNLLNGVRVQVIQGNKSFVVEEVPVSGWVYTNPYSILIFGYDYLGIVGAIKTYLGLSSLKNIQGTDLTLIMMEIDNLFV